MHNKISWLLSASPVERFTQGTLRLRFEAKKKDYQRLHGFSMRLAP
jgi:hypothetical protein